MKAAKQNTNSYTRLIYIWLMQYATPCESSDEGITLNAIVNVCGDDLGVSINAKDMQRALELSRYVRGQNVGGWPSYNMCLVSLVNAAIRRYQLRKRSLRADELIPA